MSTTLNMNGRRAVILFALVVLTGFALGAAEAQEVYRWVDENGVVNFSDRAPSAAPETGVSTLTLEDDSSVAYDPGQDLFNIQSTQERTQALREELQGQREARRERNASQPVVVQQPEQRNYGYPWDYPYGYPSLRPRPPIGPGGKPPWRPPERPRPEPPADDTATWRPPGQLPRSD